MNIVGADALGGPRGTDSNKTKIPGENVQYYGFAGDKCVY